ncbi:MAG: rubrerythrin family protein [candidate division Zixibacteria bacterium]|nr:rubrerythrin family protein [candidate division Zixibacteria bacterium]
MRKMTQDNLNSAFAGESKAHMRYLIFSECAQKEGKPNTSRLFKAIAFAEQVHAANHFKALGELGTTSQNLEAAMDGENFEVEEMYPAYLEVAKLQDEKTAQKSMNYALQAEKIHSAMYQKAKQSIDEGKDIVLKDIYICGVCGYTVEGEIPEACPVCKATKDKFKKF